MVRTAGHTPYVHLSVANPIVLGTVFMSNHYTVFDRYNERVGFAPIQDCTEGLQLANRPCAVSLPQNAQWNTCSSTLSDGSTCELTCDPGFQIDGPSGQMSCQAGSLDRIVQCVETGSPCVADPCMHDSFCIWLQGQQVASEYVCCDDPDDDPFAVQNGVTECQCPPGYTAPEGDCATQIDNCMSVPCQHGGQCDNRVNAYVCTCAPGFQGVNCQIDIDECVPDHCGVTIGRAQACTQVARSEFQDSGFVCRCNTGWSGAQCQMENACVTGSHDCGSNSLCNSVGVDAAGQAGGTPTFSCQCVNGYTLVPGTQDCEMANLCDNSPCSNGGVCTNSLNAYVCSCPPGFAGDRCESPVDGCVLNREPCGDFGQCLSDWAQPNGYQCMCQNSYTGTNCETPPANICTPATDPCQNSAMCQSQGGNLYVCHCSPGWAGDNCNAFVDPCSDAPCGVHGRCNNAAAGANNARFTCQCTGGFTGDLCTNSPAQANDVCGSAPCQNSGNCQEEAGGYECYCLPGFEDENCEINTDDCACRDESETLRGISPFTASLDCSTMVSVVQYDCAGSLVSTQAIPSRLDSPRRLRAIVCDSVPARRPGQRTNFGHAVPIELWHVCPSVW